MSYWSRFLIECVQCSAELCVWFRWALRDLKVGVMWSVTTNESWAKNIKNFKFSEEEDAV
jgi:hypothetical protein